MATKSVVNFSDISVLSNKFDGLCRRLYGTDGAQQRDRFEKLVAFHIQNFKDEDIEFYSSPGRIEIVGNHTDHNGGKVLAAAVSVDTLAAVSKRDDGRILVNSYGYPTLDVDSSKPVFSVNEIGSSAAIIKGIVDYFVKSGKKVGGFCASTTSTVPKGSGVSSSSAFELDVAEILNVMYNNSELSPMFKAKASQYAENVFFGKPCGLMDQSAIALGGVNSIDFKSFDEPQVQSAEWAFDDLDVYVIATGGDHCDLTDDYAAIPAEMKQVAACLGAKLLHEIPFERFENEKVRISGKVSARAVLRAEHFFEENERVEQAMRAISERDEAAFLDAVNESGKSSRYKLQNTFSPTGGGRELENALDSVDKVGGVVAKRVHGGGFAGTILVFVKKDFTKGANDAFELMFGKNNVFRLNIRSAGAIRLELE